MRKIRCYECKKRYDYDEDPFCPWCGAFNQRAGADDAHFDGTSIRVDGLNEEGHDGSFLHREFHREERQRRRQGLEHPRAAAQKTASPAPRPQGESVGRKSQTRSVNPIALVIGAIVMFNILVNLVAFFFSFL